MKKILITLLILIFPSFVNAQDTFEKEHQQTLQRIAKRFYPVICKEEFPAAMKAAQQCYQNATNGSVGNMECLIFNKYVINIAEYAKNPRRRNVSPIIYSDKMTDFINEYHQRLQSDFDKTFKGTSVTLDRYKAVIDDSVMKLANLINYPTRFVPYEETLHCLKNEFSRNNFMEAAGIGKKY